MRHAIIILFSILFLNGCYTIINPPMSKPAYSEEIDELNGLDASNEYEAIDDSSIIIEGDYVVYNDSHSCGYSYCTHHNHHNHHSYSYSWWWSDYNYCSYSSNYYDWYHWDHHHNYYDNYNPGYNWNSNNQKYKVAAIDYGIKYNILRLIEKEDCYIKVFPASVSSDEILSFSPDGIFLSNGPGDPAAVDYGIKTVQELFKYNIPIFGICLGHQILCLALGAQTYKLKFGHRGCNHPVKNLATGNIEITSQNHGFSVSLENLPDNISVTHISLNDQTVEGIQCNNFPAFSVQYHPEASPGPHDSQYLFNNFIKLMRIYQTRKKHA